MLAGLLVELRRLRPDLEPTVLSGNPDETRVMHGVDALPRTPRSLWQALGGARLLVCGGGSLVQDVTSARSAVYYLGTMLAASSRGVPVVVVGQGVGPLRRPWIRRLARVAFARARVISVRDLESAQVLTDLGIRTQVHRGADLALLATPAPADRAHALLAAAGIDAAVRVGVAVRPWPGLPDPAMLGGIMRRFAEARKAAVCVLVCNRVRDLAISRAVAASSGGRVVGADSPGDLLALAGTMDLILGVRLHALIFAVAQGTPAVGLAYDPKVSAFMKEQGLPGLLPVRTAGAALEQALADTWDARADLHARLIAALPEWRRAAAAGVRLATEALPPA